MELFNILFFIVIIAFGCLGFSRGLTKQIVIFVGTIIVLFIAYEFKNIIGDFFLLNLPFIKFSWGVASLNILFYQGLAFLLVVLVLEVVLKILIAITTVFEKILKYTIVLGIPSKLLGMLVGFLEGYLFAFLLAFIVTQPFFDGYFGITRTSLANSVVNNTPILSSFAKDTVTVGTEVYKLKDEEDNNKVELKLIDLCLENDVVDVDMIDKLVEKDKLKVDNLDNILTKYRK
jgi:uncharacterized membrane protein required for colicin V production